MHPSSFRSLTAATLILTSTVSWSAPAWALRPEAHAQSKAGAEELRVAFASDTQPAEAIKPPIPVAKTPVSIQPAAGAEEVLRLADLSVGQSLVSPKGKSYHVYQADKNRAMLLLALTGTGEEGGLFH